MHTAPAINSIVTRCLDTTNIHYLVVGVPEVWVDTSTGKLHGTDPLHVRLLSTTTGRKHWSHIDWLDLVAPTTSLPLEPSNAAEAV